MSLTNAECLWGAVLYAYVWLGTGYWLRRVVESIKTHDVRTEVEP